MLSSGWRQQEFGKILKYINNNVESKPRLIEWVKFIVSGDEPIKMKPLYLLAPVEENIKAIFLSLSLHIHWVADSLALRSIEAILNVFSRRYPSIRCIWANVAYKFIYWAKHRSTVLSQTKRLRENAVCAHFENIYKHCTWTDWLEWFGTIEARIHATAFVEHELLLKIWQNNASETMRTYSNNVKRRCNREQPQPKRTNRLLCVAVIQKSFVWLVIGFDKCRWNKSETG